MGTHESWWPPCSSYSDTVCFYVLLYKTCSHLVPTILSFILIAHREKLFFCKFHTTLVVYTPVFCQYFWHHLAHCFFLKISEAILTRSLKMQNEAGEYVDLYIPRYGVVRVYAFACCTFYALLYLSMTVTLWTSSALLIHTLSAFYARLAWLFSRLTRAWFTPGDINKSNILNGYFLIWNFYIRFRYGN